MEKKNHKSSRKNLAILKRAYKALCCGRGEVKINPSTRDFSINKKSLNLIDKGIQLVDIAIFNQLTRIRG